MNDFRHRYWNESVFVVDFGGIDVPSKSTQTVVGINDKVKKAYESGKPVLFTGVKNHNVFFSPVKKSSANIYTAYCGEYKLQIGLGTGSDDVIEVQSI